MQPNYLIANSVEAAIASQSFGDEKKRPKKRRIVVLAALAIGLVARLVKRFHR